MKNTKGFGLIEIIIIIVITAVIASITTGVIIMNSDVKEEIISDNSSNDKELDNFIQIYKTIKDKYYDQIDYEKMLKTAEEAMIKFLGDKYTIYMNDEEYNEIQKELSGLYNGIGVILLGNRVLYIMEDSNADKMGIEEYDEIISIDDNSVVNKKSSEILSLIENSKNNDVQLLIKRENEDLEINIQKEKLEIPSLFYRIIDENIGYVYLKNFSDDLDKKLKDALNSIEKNIIKGLIIDLRDNPGGRLDIAENVSNIFLEKGKNVYSLQTNSSTITYKDTTDEKKEYPIAVLINSQTASAAEILAAALKESYGASLVGTKTYGKGKVQQVKNLNNGNSIKYTTAKWLTPNMKCIDNVGILPDITVSFEKNDENIEFDTQIMKAIETLNK